MGLHETRFNWKNNMPAAPESMDAKNIGICPGCSQERVLIQSKNFGDKVCADCLKQEQ